MKKLLLLTTLLIGALTLHAESYAYLTFETNSGAKVSIPASSLTITISDNTLTVGSVPFTLTNLDKMYFSNTDETTNIKSISAEELNEATEVYDLNGRKITKEQMQKGLYIVKSKCETYKIVMR